MTNNKKTLKKRNKFILNRIALYIGLVTGLIGLVTLVYQGAQALYNKGVKKGQQYAYNNIIEYISQITDKVRIIDATCYPKEIIPGETCEIRVSIKNDTDYESELWIGTTAIDFNGNEYWNPQQDEIVNIAPKGITYSTRKFTIPKKIKEGKCSINVNLWYGKKSNPDLSTRISSVLMHEIITVKMISNYLNCN